MWNSRHTIEALSFALMLLLPFLVALVFSQSSTATLPVQSSGRISYTPQPLLRVNGIYIEDGLGNRVKLKGVNVDKNERVKKYGATYDANFPEETWFTEEDIRRIKEAGGNLIEIHINPLTSLMPKRNVVNEEYFARWIDKWVNWTTKYQLYTILDIVGMGARSDWQIANSLPDWLWEGLYPKPETKTEYDAIIRDFFNLSVTKQNINREAFINLWKFIANRYKSNPYVMFSIMNEPFCGVEPMGGTDANIALAESYSHFMEMIVDAIRSTGAHQLIFINKPYLSDFQWKLAVKPVNRDNIVWEDHAYINKYYPSFNDWKKIIDESFQKFVVEFNKPLFIGEYGFDPLSLIRTNYPTTWKQILTNQVTYLDSLQIVGRQWHQWGLLDGEYYDFATPSESGDLTAEESVWIIENVLG